MSARNSMTHRCVIQRDQSLYSDSDPYGNDADPVWARHLESVACRFWFRENVYDANQVTGGERVLNTTNYLILPLDTEVTEKDRVLEVRDRRGQILAQGPFHIDTFGRRKDHIVVTMEGTT